MREMLINHPKMADLFTVWLHHPIVDVVCRVAVQRGVTVYERANLYKIVYRLS